MQEDTKGEKLRYENESFRIRVCPCPSVVILKSELLMPHPQCSIQPRPVSAKVLLNAHLRDRAAGPEISGPAKPMP
jgi:hypothetical protein